MLKTVLFASVAVSALCLGPTFGWPTQLPNPLSHEMSIDRISTVSNSPLRILPTHGPSTSSSDEEDGEGSNGARGRRAQASTLAIIPFPSASQQATKKRKVNNDDDNDSEDVTAIVTQDVQEPHPFQVILMVDDANQFFSDVLDLKSYLALASTNKNVHVRKVITDKIMSKDLRGLHRIQWQGGPQVKTFLNYLFNRTVWEAQREVLRAVHYMNDESESDEFADLARLVKRLDDPCLDGLYLEGQPRLEPSVRESVQPIKRIFDDLYGLMGDAFKTRRPLDFGLTVYKHMTPLTGKNLMDKKGGERQMAFFLEHLIRLNQARLNNQLQVVPADFKESYYYDAPSSPEKRSVVERFENSVGSKRQLVELSNIDERTTLKEVRILAQLFKDDILFTIECLEDLRDLFDHCVDLTSSSLNGFTQEQFESDYAEAGSIFYEALDAYHSEIAARWSVHALRNAAQILGTLYESDPRVKYLVKNLELRELRLTRLGDAADDTDVSDTAEAYGDLWDAGIKQIHILERSAELSERALILKGDLAKVHNFGCAAATYRQLWQADPTQTHHLVRSITLFEKKDSLLQERGAMDVFKKAWYALQHSRIDSAQSHRREEAKTLWQQALKMGIRDEELNDDDQTLFDTLNAEFGDRTPEDL